MANTFSVCTFVSNQVGAYSRCPCLLLKMCGERHLLPNVVVPVLKQKRPFRVQAGVTVRSTSPRPLYTNTETSPETDVRPWISMGGVGISIIPSPEYQEPKWVPQHDF